MLAGRETTWDRHCGCTVPRKMPCLRWLQRRVRRHAA